MVVGLRGGLEFPDCSEDLRGLMQRHSGRIPVCEGR